MTIAVYAFGRVGFLILCGVVVLGPPLTLHCLAWREVKKQRAGIALGFVAGAWTALGIVGAFIWLIAQIPPIE